MLDAVVLTPLNEIASHPAFFVEVLIGGLLTGVMYALVALGFVLIFKASGVFNFAQGAMVLFAALTFVGLMEQGLAMPLALVATAVVMVALAVVVERAVLRPLVGQPPIALFMATIGIAFFLDGFGLTLWGSDVKRLDVGIPTDPLIVGGVFVNGFDAVAAAVCGVLVLGLALFFRYTAVGRALRAVADDPTAAMSVGIPLAKIWIIVWSVAGVVGLVAGIVWGAKLGVQFTLSLIALKALPVLILGGLTSIPGAILGGLIIGAGENVFEVFWIDWHGGASQDWFAYVLATLILLVRPQGLFGEKIIERV